ncbi:MAG: Peptidase family [Actinomycetia bacterium]|nr:Peptidase family [Actinomycetes bacterium]
MTELDDGDYEGLADDVRRVAVHEAGHAVVTELLGHDVGDIYVDLDTGWAGHTGVPDGLSFEHTVTVALAGFAAVGVILGPDAEETLRTIDDPTRENSDHDRVRKALEKAEVPEDKRAGVVEALDVAVRKCLALPHIGDMVEEITIRLEDHGGMPGLHIKATVQGYLDEHRRATGEDGNPFQ